MHLGITSPQALAVVFEPKPAFFCQGMLRWGLCGLWSLFPLVGLKLRFWMNWSFQHILANFHLPSCSYLKVRVQGCSIFAKSSCPSFLSDLEDNTISVALSSVLGV